MDKDKEDTLLSLLEEWFEENDEKYKRKQQDRRWQDGVGLYIKSKLNRMGHWKNLPRNVPPRGVNPFK